MGSVYLKDTRFLVYIDSLRPLDELVGILAVGLSGNVSGSTSCFEVICENWTIELEKRFEWSEEDYRSSDPTTWRIDLFGYSPDKEVTAEEREKFIARAHEVLSAAGVQTDQEP